LKYGRQLRKKFPDVKPEQVIFAEVVVPAIVIYRECLNPLLHTSIDLK